MEGMVKTHDEIFGSPREFAQSVRDDLMQNHLVGYSIYFDPEY